MNPSKNVRTKIAVGYALIIVVCILSVGYVYRQVERFTGPDDSRMQVQSRRSLVNQTLYHLYQAEGYGQFMIAGYPSYERRYRDELRVVRDLLDSLGAWGAGGSDSLQRIRLDSISSLIDVKERSTLGLQRTIRSSGTATLLSRNIERLLPPDTLRADTTARIRIRQDTVSVPKRKRGFFRRLGDVFSPPKDSNVVISTRMVVDSLPPAAVKDTIAGVLRDLQDRVNSQRQEIYERAWNDGNVLKYSNRQINEKIYRLLDDFEREETAYLMARMNERSEVKRRSSLILGAIAATAIVLMLLFVGILWRDISRSNRYKRELEEANRANEALLAAREKLMLAITHDIKAPLGSIIGYIDLLLRLAEGKREGLYLRNMKASADHLLGLVGNLLDFYRLDAHKIEVSEVAFNPAELFAQIAEGFAPVAAAKGIALHLDAASAADREVAGDPLRIRQITDNLLSNALKFTDRGSVAIGVDLHGSNLVFSVRDTGRGIAREERERIFGEFVRLRSARGVGGVGLGLSIVDRLVKLLGGRIYLESRPGRGSKFIVTLPVKPTGNPSTGVLPATPSVPSPCGPARLKGVRCLLVDDDALQLEMAAAMCREAGCAVECCAYPEYAAKLVAEHPFDVVLTDIQMPGVDGFGVLERIRAVAPQLPVVAVSARSDHRDDYLGRGFAAVVCKPFSAGELTGAIRAALGREPGTRQDDPPKPRKGETDTARQGNAAETGRERAVRAAAGSDPAVSRPADAAGFRAADGAGSRTADGAGSRTADGAGSRTADGAGSRTADGAGSRTAYGADSRTAYGAGSRTAYGACARAADGAGFRTADGAGSRTADGAGSRAADGAGSRTADGAGSRAADGAGFRAADGAATGRAASVLQPDFDALTAFARDDAQAAARIIRTFAEQTSAHCLALAEASATGDAAAVAALAHKMLPLLTMLRAGEIAALLRRLERLDGPLTPELRTAVGRMVESIEEIVKQARKRYLCEEKQ